MSAVVVTKSLPATVVPSSESEPSGAAGDSTVRLSPFDKCVAPFPVTMLLAFDRPIQEPVGTIKSALSRALAHYRPIAGRLGDGGIACTDEGVTFVGASAACALDEVTTLDELTVRYPGDFCRPDEPLLMVQVTEFSCGGFAVGVTFNHVAVDGAGMAQFLGAVGELARGTMPSVAPVRRWDDSLPGLPASMVDAQKSTMTHGLLSLARLDITVPWSVIDRVRAESGGAATVFEAVAAVLWQCRTRAVVISPDEPSSSPAPLAFPSDVRAQVGARAGYYGNCVVVQMVPATSRAVVTATIGDLVALIKRARKKVPDLLRPQSSLPSKDDDGEAGAAAEGEQQQPELAYNALVVVSWRRLGFDAVDMGGGGPARVTWHEVRTVVPGCVVCPPCRGEEEAGVSVAAICVKPEHAAAFSEELASMGIRVVAPSPMLNLQ